MSVALVRCLLWAKGNFIKTKVMSTLPDLWHSSRRPFPVSLGNVLAGFLNVYLLFGFISSGIPRAVFLLRGVPSVTRKQS